VLVALDFYTSFLLQARGSIAQSPDNVTLVGNFVTIPAIAQVEKLLFTIR
jgi:hypothetical protein